MLLIRARLDEAGRGGFDASMSYADVPGPRAAAAAWRRRRPSAARRSRRRRAPRIRSRSTGRRSARRSSRRAQLARALARAADVDVRAEELGAGPVWRRSRRTSGELIARSGRSRAPLKRGGRRRCCGRRPVFDGRSLFSNLIYGAKWPTSFTIDLSPRTALITGGSRGIGRATADLLARAGARVAINYLRDEAAANARGARDPRGRRRGDGARRATSREPEQARQLVRDVVAAWERLDILVNNAGHLGRGRRRAAATSTVWDRTYAVNLRGAFLVTDAAVAAPREARRLDRLRLLDRGPAGRGAALRVRRLQGRADLVHEVAGRRARPAGHPRQLRRARAGSTPTCRAAALGNPVERGRDREVDPDRPRRLGGGHRRARSSSSSRTSRGTSRARS